METKIRNGHAFRLFDAVLSLERQNGKSLDEARKAAFDAVELRYGITPKTLQNYMTAERASGHCENGVFERESAELVELLRVVNEKISEKISDMQDMLVRNERLLELLKQTDASIH